MFVDNPGGLLQLCQPPQHSPKPLVVPLPFLEHYRRICKFEASYGELWDAPAPETLNIL